jgi:hypothetical protein
MLFVLAGLSSCWLDFLHTRWRLCTCWLDFVHAGSAFYMLAGLSARWLDFVHAGWTCHMLTGLSCMLADFLHFLPAACTLCVLVRLSACSRFQGSIPGFSLSVWMCDLWTHYLVWHGTFTSQCRSTVFVFSRCFSFYNLPVRINFLHLP